MSFFREDLKLNEKRWHRLLKVLFIVFIICLTLRTYASVTDFKYTPGYVEVWELRNRFTSEFKSVSEYLNKWEYIGNSRFYVDTETKTNQLYCSNIMYEHVSTMNIRWFEKVVFNISLNDSDNGSVEDVHSDWFSTFLKENDIKCIWIQNESVWSYWGVDDFNIYRKSLIMLVWDYFEPILTTTLSTILISLSLLIFYYKVFVYIIYWNIKK